MLSQFSNNYASIVIVVPLKTCFLDDCIDWNKLVLMACGSVEFIFDCFLFAPIASRENNYLQAVIIRQKGWRYNKIIVPICIFKKKKYKKNCISATFL